MTRYRHFTISVPGYDAFVVGAETRSRARAKAFSSFNEMNPDVSFLDFALRVRVTSADVPSPDGYDYVRRNYGLDVSIGQRVRLKDEGAISGSEGEVIYPGPNTAHVHVLLDGHRYPTIAHPFSIEAVA